MSLETTADWKNQADGSMLELLKSEAPPNSYRECRQNPTWDEMVHMYAKACFATENFDFLDEAEKYQANPDPAHARDIYHQYIKEGANTQINIASDPRRELDEFFETATWGGDLYPPARYPEELFDNAYQIVFSLIDLDVYQRFTNNVSAVRRALLAEEAEAARAAEAPAAVEQPAGAPAPAAAAPQASPAVLPAQDLVDESNREALKALDEGNCTVFYEIGGTVVIEAESGTVKQYLDVARTEPGFPDPGLITVVKRGSPFDPGMISVASVKDRDLFEAAIRRVSKKKVTY